MRSSSMAKRMLSAVDLRLIIDRAAKFGAVNATKPLAPNHCIDGELAQPRKGWQVCGLEIL